MRLFDDKTNLRAAQIWKYALSAVAGLITIWIAMRFASIIIAWSFYSQFFQKIREVGGLPDFLSGAIAIWCVVATILLIPAVTLSIFVKQRRKTVLITAGALSLWMVFLYGLSVQQSKNFFNPMTGNPNYKYSRDTNGKIKLFAKDYSFDPETGKKLDALTGEALYEYEAQKAGERMLKEQQEIQHGSAPLEKGPGQKTIGAQTVKNLAQSLPDRTFQPPQPRSKPPAIVASGKSNDLLLDVHPCSRDGNLVHCAISATNLSDLERWELFQPGSSLLDDSGNQYYSSEIRGPNSYIPNHAVNVSFVFKNVIQSARNCSLTLKHHGTGNYHGEQSITFDNIPIQ